MGQPAFVISSLPLFHSFDLSLVQWDKVLHLRDDSAAGRAFQHLIRWKASAVDLARPDIAGLDYRRRLTDLRKLGIPIITEPIEGKPYHCYSLPPDFVAEYWRHRRSA